jgi:hypothetical protein
VNRWRITIPKLSSITRNRLSRRSYCVRKPEANAAVGGGTPATRHDRLPQRREPVIALVGTGGSFRGVDDRLLGLGFLRRFAVGRFGR